MSDVHEGVEWDLSGDLLLTKKIICGNGLNLKIHLSTSSTWRRNGDSPFRAKPP